MEYSNYNIKISKTSDYAQMIQHRLLLEEFGIRDYSNDDFNEEIRQISIDLVKSRNTETATIINKHNKTSLTGNLYQYEISSVKWLDKLNIFISHQFLSEEPFVDVMVLADSVSYSFKYNDYGIIEPTDQTIDMYDIEFDLFLNGDRIDYFKRINGKMKVATILFIFNKTHYSEYEFETALHHELSHISDSIYKSVPKINSEIIDTDIITDISDVRYLLNLTNSQIKEYIKTIDNDAFIDTITYFYYMLNVSEMKARLNNFRYDIAKNSNIETLKRNIKRHQVDLLKTLQTLSEDFYIYYNLYRLYGLYQKYLTDEQKQNCMDQINIFINRVRPRDEIKYTFGRTFKTTDELLSFLRQRIYDNFIVKSTAMIIDIMNIHSETETTGIR